jgi:hypothetical protein
MCSISGRVSAPSGSVGAGSEPGRGAMVGVRFGVGEAECLPGVAGGCREPLLHAADPTASSPPASTLRRLGRSQGDGALTRRSLGRRPQPDSTARAGAGWSMPRLLSSRLASPIADS